MTAVSRMGAVAPGPARGNTACLPGGQRIRAGGSKRGLEGIRRGLEPVTSRHLRRGRARAAPERSPAARPAGPERRAPPLPAPTSSSTSKRARTRRRVCRHSHRDPRRHRGRPRIRRGRPRIRRGPLRAPGHRTRRRVRRTHARTRAWRTPARRRRSGGSRRTCASGRSRRNHRHNHAAGQGAGSNRPAHVRRFRQSSPRACGLHASRTRAAPCQRCGHRMRATRRVTLLPSTLARTK
jgi:hypothetical protein